MGAACKKVLSVWAAIAALPIFSAVLVGPVYAQEAPPVASAEMLLGADIKGENWTVAPDVQSDGFLRLFNVTTPYDEFQIGGERRMNERLQELRALQILEQMSRTTVFTDALERGAMAPIRFGRDLVDDPIETTGNFFSGVGRTLRSVAGGVQSAVTDRDGPPARDPLFERIVGITRTERELAAQLGVDPHSDYVPLRTGLADVANVSVAGGFSISAAISAIPGGAGVVASYGATGAKYSRETDGLSSGQIVERVAEELLALGVAEETAKRFTDNQWFSPFDLFVIADSLELLHAENAEGFVALAADAASFDVAKFHRHRAELLASELVRERLGVLGEFVVVSGVALSRNSSGTLVAVFPFDVVSWTYATQEVVIPLSQGIAALGEANAPIFAMTGDLTPNANYQLRQLGWTLASLD
nr:MAG: hypothetical protein E4H34_04995 [Hyphomicrobiales bacterium]